MVFLKIFLVLLTVLLSIASALILDYAAARGEIIAFTMGAIVAAFSLNILKFFLWGAIHKRYDLSDSYPLVALFYPAIFSIALFQGEAEVTFFHLVGIILISSGVVVMNLKGGGE